MLLNPFQQQDQRVDKELEVKGLGLWISSQIVEKMEGKLTIQSSKNLGSAFSVEVPLETISEEQMYSPPLRRIALLKSPDK